MQKIISKIISYVFHPVLMPALGIILLLNSNSYLSLIPDPEKKFIYYIVIGCTIVLPLMLIPVFLFNSYIHNFNLDNKEDRKLPYLITLGSNYFAYYILKKVEVPGIILSFILASFFTITFTLLLSLKYKISAHMAGIGGLTGLIIILSFSGTINAKFSLISVFLISGLIGYARLYLNAHNSFQVYSGYILGLIVVLVSLLFLT